MPNTVTLTFAGDASKLDKAMKGVGQSAQKMASEVGQASDKMAASAEAGHSKFTGTLGKLKGAALIGGAAIGTGLTAAFAKSMEFGSATAKLDAQLGAGSAASKQAGTVAGKLYAGAYGESMAAVGEAVKTVMQSGVAGIGATDDQVQKLTGNVMSLSDAFGQDLNGTVNAVGQMMRTGLAKNGQEALDILTVGFQKGNDKAGDLLDTFNEYGTQFRKIGLDGKTAMGLISQGLQAGARDADIVADSIKEFSIRAIDGSKNTADGFKSLGLSAKKMADDVAAGGPRASAALGLTLDKLREIKDPAERARIAVELFGTQAEDLGDALYALDLDTAAQGMGNIDGAAQKLNDTLGDTAQNKIESVKRKFEQWTTSMIQTKGPVGDVGAMVAAFGPQALGVLGPLGSMLGALKMQGAVSALKGVGAELDTVGQKASGADMAAKGSKGGFAWGKGFLGGLGLAGVAVGATLLLDQLIPKDAGRSYGAGFARDMLAQMAGVLSGSEGNIFKQWEVARWIASPLQMATDATSRAFQQMAGIASSPISINFHSNTGPAHDDLVGFMNSLKGTSGSVNIDGRTEDAVQALANIVQDINNGKGEVDINGQPMPAQDALKYVIAQIDRGVGTVSVNGNPQPAGQVLAGFLGQVNRSHGEVGVGANTSSAYSTVSGFVNNWNGRHINLIVTALGSGGSGSIARLASGGPVSGPGTGTSDTAGLFALSNGEFVATKKRVDNAGGPAAFERLMQTLDRDQVRGMAGGGSPMRSTARAALRAVPGPSGGAAGGVAVTFTGNTSDALATVIMQMVRTGKIQIKAA